MTYRFLHPKPMILNAKPDFKIDKKHALQKEELASSSARFVDHDDDYIMINEELVVKDQTWPSNDAFDVLALEFYFAVYSC
jgi:hypothetical protein